MKKLSILAILSFFSIALFGGQSTYSLNHEKVDALFKNATEVNVSSFAVTNTSHAATNSDEDMISFGEGEKEPVVAWLLTYVFPGLHRVYLGTKPMTFVGYVLTGGGCGIVQFVDWVVLLIGIVDDDVSEYVNNPKFFMW